MDRSLLILEEDMSFRRALRDWLEVMIPDCHVSTAASEEEAAALARSRSPRVILVDVTSPDMDGIAFIREIKSAVPSVKIVALTIGNYRAYRDNLTSAGASACLHIGSIPGELRPMLEELLAQGRDAAGDNTVDEQKTVVCIEDDPDIVDMIRVILEREGFELIGALGGGEGLDTVREVKPDLVLLDLMMPDVDGWEVARRMKADDETKGIPIIVLTVIPPTSERVDDLEVDDYVTKPFAPEDLVRRVSTALRIVA